MSLNSPLYECASLNKYNSRLKQYYITKLTICILIHIEVLLPVSAVPSHTIVLSSLPANRNHLSQGNQTSQGQKCSTVYNCDTPAARKHNQYNKYRTSQLKPGHVGDEIQKIFCCHFDFSESAIHIQTLVKTTRVSSSNLRADSDREHHRHSHTSEFRLRRN